MLAFAAVMAFGARHLAQKVFASRVVLGDSDVELKSPLKPRRRVAYSELAGVEEGTMEVSIDMRGQSGTEHVDVLRFHLVGGETIALYAPDASARRNVIDALAPRLAR